MRKFGTVAVPLVLLAALTAGPTRADPLGGKEPWNFTPVNRAGLAIAIKQAEDGDKAGGGSGGGTTIVCGGTSGGSGDGSVGSGSSATANNNCIIINNSDGAIVDVDQHSNGNQSSNSNANSTSSTTNHSIDEVSDILNGGKQGGL